MKGLLLDTHVLVWTAVEPQHLTRKAISAIEGADQLFISAMTSYELGYLATRGRLVLTDTPAAWLDMATLRLGLVILPITHEIATAAAALDYGPGDPGDRMIMSTARCLELPLCTADRAIRGFGGVHVIW